MSRKFIANSTQLPNSIVDEVMKDISGNDLKCYLVITRKTTGWHKNRDGISISQFHEITGIKNVKTIRNSLKHLESIGLIVGEECEGKPTLYSLNLPDIPLPKNDGGQKTGPLPKKGSTPLPKNGRGTPTKKPPPQKQLSKTTSKTKNIYPENLNIEAWELWMTHRKQCGLPKYKTKQTINKLAGYSMETQAKAVTNSMQNEWRGLFPENIKNENSKTNTAKPGSATAGFWNFVEDAIPEEIRGD